MSLISRGFKASPPTNKVDDFLLQQAEENSWPRSHSLIPSFILLNIMQRYQGDKVSSKQFAKIV